MGSLILPTKAPASRTVVQQVPTPSVANEEPTEMADETPADVLSSEARSENLLRRNRGRFGTILTGFRGVLDSRGDQKNRKTLLGE